jgi:23S rRNA (cytosine1962-C5)-methyltransferase
MNSPKNSDLILPSITDGEDKSSPLGNRIRKNYRHLRKWAKRTHTDCFRIYGRDIKEYPLAIDFYAGRFCVQYFSSTNAEDGVPFQLQEETERALITIFGVSKEDIFWRTRSKHKETRQYEKKDSAKEFFIVHEYGLSFRVNLMDYIDTGLFLDHRETRHLVASMSPEKRLLNLFAYTCSFSIHAAAARASFTKSVDMSNTYTEWGRANFELNDLPSSQNPIVRADCLKFLDEEALSDERYDIIVIDPPTMSRSKKMDQLFDVNVDYVTLIRKSLKLLLKDGVIVFSTNSRKFAFDTTLFPNTIVRDISHKTVPIDFRDKKIHRCWLIHSA